MSGLDRFGRVSGPLGRSDAASVLRAARGAVPVVARAAADRPVIASIGDSLTRMNYSDVAYTYPRVTNKGYLYWSLALAGARMRQGRSKGISGAKTDAILSTALPVVLDRAANPRLDEVIIHAGTNDLTALKTASQADVAVAALVANVIEMSNRCVDFGARPTVSAVLRRTDVGAGIPTGKQTIFDAAWLSANGLLRQFAESNGYPFLDMNRYWVDGTDAYFSGVANADNVHPTIIGAQALGRTGAALVSGLSASLDWVNHGYVAEVTGNPLLAVGAGGSALANSSGVQYTGGAAAVIPEQFSMGDLAGNNSATATVSRDGDGLLSVSITAGGVVLERSFSGLAGQTYEVVSAFEISSGGNNSLFSVTTDLINSSNQQLVATGAQDDTTTMFYGATGVCKDATHRVALPANGTFRARVLIRSNGNASAAVVKVSELACYRAT